MTILATCRIPKGGTYGVPYVGEMKGGETREVSMEAALWMRNHPYEFELSFPSPEGLPYRDASGKVAFCNFFGPVDPTFGYGSGGVSILRALASAGIETNVQSWVGPFQQTASDLPVDVRRQLERRGWIAPVTIAQGLPTDLHNVQSAYTVSWTMIEQSSIPDGSLKTGPYQGDWAQLINQHADHLVVPCHHNAEVFARCGVEKPIDVIPYGLDTDIWEYQERPERDLFTVVQFGDLSARKSPFEAVMTFQRAFPDNPNVRLILKTTGDYIGYSKPVISDPRVTLIYGEVWSRPELREWLYNADCFIWLSKGEGFGLPPVQALLTGLPVVTTTHTGMAEWFNEKYAYGVNSLPLEPSPIFGDWYPPDVDHAAIRLRQVYDDRAKARRKAKAGNDFIRKNFSIEAFGTRISGFLNNLQIGV